MKLTTTWWRSVVRSTNGFWLLQAVACTPLSFPDGTQNEADDAGDAIARDGGRPPSGSGSRTNDASAHGSVTVGNAGSTGLQTTTDSGQAAAESDGTDGSDHDSGALPDQPPQDSGMAKVLAPDGTGPYTVASYTGGYRDGPSFSAATVYYPSDSPSPLPYLAIITGFVSGQSTMQPWATFLASYGFVVINVEPNKESDVVAERESALLDALESLRAENARAGSPLRSKLDLPRAGVMGWGMGGGAALSAAAEHPELKTVVAICPWNPDVSYAGLTVPTLFLAAQNDELEGGQATTFYNSMPGSTSRLLWERAGVTGFDNNEPSAESFALGRYAVSWLKVFLQGDESYREFIVRSPPAASIYKSNVVAR
ncbi:MAG: secreted hydrolase, alpha/beta family [Myxococcaceae bacterium]|nr:secreted hydrolase, alpha/beta family [Myxococcaceae bacterium]